MLSRRLAGGAHAGHGCLPAGLGPPTAADQLLLIASHDVVEDVRDALADRLWVDAALGVEGDLPVPPPVRLIDGLRHRGRDRVGVYVHLTGHVSRRPADGLDE